MSETENEPADDPIRPKSQSELYDNVAADNRQRRDDESKLRVDDGFVIILVKKLSGLQHLYHNYLLCRFLRGFWKLGYWILRRCCCDFPEKDADYISRAAWRLAIDFYLAFWAAVLFACYGVTFYVVGDPTWAWVLWVTGGLASWRVYEIVCYEALYHSRGELDKIALQGQYAEIVRTLWHYVEIVFIFGVFYLIVGHCAPTCDGWP
jgi:hypothetical protein